MKIAFQCQPSQWFDVVLGNTYTETMTETLNSASFIVTHLDQDLLNGCKPYDFCVIKNEKGTFSKEMMVDTIVSTKKRMGATTFWEYTGTLMSETKYLEKIQLPNKCFTHDEGGEQLTLAQAIDELMQTYMPVIRVRGSSGWSYQKLFSVGTLPARFSTVKLKDVMMSQPTLRQAITSVMAQEGCIPVVNNRVLTAIDFKAQGPSYTLASRDYTSFRRSMASDSYVTGLVSMADDVLDNANDVVVETIGFRDPSSAIISQTSNMYLNTTLPIYHVDRLEMNWNGSYTATLHNMYAMTSGTYSFLEYAQILFKSDFTGIGFKLEVPDSYSQYNFGVRFKNIQVMFVNVDGTTGKTTFAGGVPVLDQDIVYTAGSSPLRQTISIPIASNVIPSNATDITVTCEVELSTSYPGHQDEYMDVYIRYPDFGGGVYDSQMEMYGFRFSWTHAENALKTYAVSGTVLSFDITPVVYEKERRKLLNTNFLEMVNGEETIAQISQYYQGTLEYAIGGTQITGFSDTYSEVPAGSWWTIEKTHMEVIVEAIFNDPASFTDAFKGSILDFFYLPSFYTIGPSVSNQYGVNISIGSTTDFGNFVTNSSFNISYQPMNKIHVRYDKSDSFDVSLPVDQLDTKQDGIAAMDDLSAVETDKCDRLGRPTLMFSERVTSYDDLIPLGAVITDEDDAIVFQREIAFDNGYLNVTYLASQSYVIRNYSTAIQTKYRAYSYVAYGAAVERKELAKTYCLITDSYTGDDLSVLGNWTFARSDMTLTDVLFPFATGNRVMTGFRGESMSPYVYVNNLSVVSYGSDLVLSMMDFDSQSYGLWIKNVPQLGGVPQMWYIMGDGKPEFGFGKAMDPTAENIGDIAINSPLSAPSYYVNVYHSYAMRKDVSEKMGFTFQMELYTDCPTKVAWTDHLMEYNTAVAGVKYFQAPYGALAEEPYEDGSQLSPVSAVSLAPYSVTVAQDCKIVAQYQGMYYDLISFKAGTYRMVYSECKGRQTWTDNGNVFAPDGDRI